ncbi:MAG: cycloartenol synthase [Verrucomicrobiales bacterium]|nr:cycloartenol synthase [Verrucomicrobiales bacterium]
MSTSHSLSTALLIVISLSTAHSQETIANIGDTNLSLKLEIERAISSGVTFLEAEQNPETGAWSDPTLPAITALSISSILGDPALGDATTLPDSAEKGYEFLLSQVKSDGGIYGKGLATYNTALSIMALVQSGEEEHLPVIAKARRLLINQQQDFDRRGATDNLFDGGIGYGGSYAHSDLSNTHLAMEALYYSKKALSDTAYDDSSEFDLDWDAAIDFVSLAQNSKATVDRLGEKVGLREEDEGGFIYFPGDTKSDEVMIQGDDGTKRTALRSYGSMSYAGLLAFIYADMNRDDPRIASVMSWLERNFTLEENPGMNAQGLFYYYHTMSKALGITGTNYLVTPDGEKIDWKEDLALEVMSRQQSDGAWMNEDSNRWMEDNRVLVTAYSLLTLQQVYRSL